MAKGEGVAQLYQVVGLGIASSRLAVCIIALAMPGHLFAQVRDPMGLTPDAAAKLDELKARMQPAPYVPPPSRCERWKGRGLIARGHGPFPGNYCLNECNLQHVGDGRYFYSGTFCQARGTAGAVNVAASTGEAVARPEGHPPSSTREHISPRSAQHVLRGQASNIGADTIPQLPAGFGQASRKTR